MGEGEGGDGALEEEEEGLLVFPGKSSVSSLEGEAGAYCVLAAIRFFSALRLDFLFFFFATFESSSSFSTLPSMRRTEMEAFPLPLYVHPTLGVKGLAPPLAPSVQAVPPSATFFDSALHPGPHVTPSAAAAAAAA